MKKVTSCWFVCLCWVFAAAWVFCSWGARGPPLMWCTGFSLRWLLLLWSTVCRHTGFSCCGSWAFAAYSVWNLLRPGIEPTSPALAGRFLSIIPPGQSNNNSIFNSFFWLCHAACKLLVHSPGIGPVPPALKVQHPNHWATRDHCV